jgi:hypothetical protein
LRFFIIFLGGDNVNDIVFRLKDNKLNIIVDSNLSNKDFLTKFKERLDDLLVVNLKISKSVILNLNENKLDNREILQLFDILNEHNNLYLSKIICKSKKNDSLVIYHGNFRCGQIRFFDKSTLIIGNINPGSKIIVNGNLYVLGVINGDIELKDKTSRIYCETIFNSLVKIASVFKLYSEEKFSKVIYLDNKEIKESDYTKGEISNVKSNSCYLR